MKIKILKLTDILKVQNCLVMYQAEQNNAIATSFQTLHPKTITRPDLQPKACQMYLQQEEVSMYDKVSVKYQCIRDWNNFKKRFLQIPENKLPNMKIKRILKQAIFDQY